MTRALPAAALVPIALAAGIAAFPAAAQNTRNAALAQLRAEFAQSDVDRDGVLTRAEVAARIDHMKTAGATHALSAAQAKQLTDLWFQRTDANRDGRVTLDEAEGEMAKLFDRYDLNRDGVISAQERAAARANLKAQGAAPKKR